MSQPAAVTADLLRQLQAALATRDRAGTVAAVAGLVAGGAALGEQWRRIAQLMQVSGEIDLALAATDRLVAQSADRAAAGFARVAMLFDLGRIAEGEAALAALPPGAPDPATRGYLAANAAIAMGDAEKARRLLEDVVTLRPGSGAAWLTLAMTGSLVGTPFADRLVAAAAEAAKSPPNDRARYHYALGRLFADLGDADAAFAEVARGAALLAAQTPQREAADAANAEEAMHGYDPATLARFAAAAGPGGSRPIFVTGLPRSGTTLVEHILARQPGIRAGGELNLIQHAAAMAGGVGAGALDRMLAASGTLAPVGDLYRHVVAQRCGTGARVVDKTVDASRFVGVIASTLPDATIIWLRRDPLDCAWSCFRTFFIGGVTWSNDLAAMGRHFALEDRLMAFWQRQLGDRLLVVPYADLVESPDLWTRRLLDHAGIAGAAVPADAAPVQAAVTNSALQVRRPINRDGIGSAAPYARHLQPFVDAYVAAGGSISATDIP